MTSNCGTAGGDAEKLWPRFQHHGFGTRLTVSSVFQTSPPSLLVHPLSQWPLEILVEHGPLITGPAKSSFLIVSLAHLLLEAEILQRPLYSQHNFLLQDATPINLCRLQKTSSCFRNIGSGQGSVVSPALPKRTAGGLWSRVRMYLKGRWND